METNSILTANILDILFEGRNKAYGAYDLRNTYSKRIRSALSVTTIAILIFVIAISWKNKYSSKSVVTISVDAILHPPPPKQDIVPPTPKIIKPQQIKTAAFPPPIIVKNELVTDPPIENDKLSNQIIDVKNKEGDKYEGIVPPEAIKNSNVIETPVKKEEPELPFTSVEIEAKFTGNWSKYLQKEIEKNLDELTEAAASGTCIVRFVVSKDGSVSNVEAITMKGTKLAEVAVNAIRKGPKWIPAMQNGVQVNAYRQQPVTFTITD